MAIVVSRFAAARESRVSLSSSLPVNVSAPEEQPLLQADRRDRGTCSEVPVSARVREFVGFMTTNQVCVMFL
jgi:hypothetical protein